MPDPFGATTPEEEEELMLRAYHQAQRQPAGQRLASFQQAAADPFAQYMPQQPTFTPAASPPAGSAAAAAVDRTFAPYMPQQPSYAPKPAVTIPEVDVAPRPGLPGTMPGQGAARPKPGIGKAQLDAAIRQEAAPAEEGRLLPHKVGLTVKPMLQGERALLEEAETEEFAAQQEQGEAQIQGAQDVANQLVQHADEQESIDQSFAERELERQSMLRDYESRFSDMIDKTLSEPIESPSLFGEDAGSQIVNRIAVFLGTLGAAGGGPNYAYDKLQKDVERKIAAQKEQRAQGIERLKLQPMLIDMARERFKSEAAVDTVMREAAYRRLGAELERFKEFAKTPERKAALDALKARNDANLMQLEIQRRQAMDADVLRERQIKAAAAARPDPAKALERAVKTRELEARGVKADREIEGKTGEDAKAIRKAQADYEATIASVDRYERSNIDVGITSDKALKARAEQEQQSAARTYQKEFLGASENDAKSAEKAFPAGGTLTRKESVRQAAQAARQRAKDKRDAAIKAAGGNPGGFTPQGQR